MFVTFVVYYAIYKCVYTTKLNAYFVYSIIYNLHCIQSSFYIHMKFCNSSIYCFISLYTFFNVYNLVLYKIYIVGVLYPFL